MTTTITTATLGLIEGDSLPSIGNYMILNGLLRYIWSHYNRGVGGSFRAPMFRNQAVSGAVISDVNGRIAAELAANPYNLALIVCGVNDAKNSVLLATSLSNCDGVMDKCNAAGATVIWIGPLLDGEKYPTGANGAVDAAIDALDAGLATHVAARGGIYISARSLVYAVQEPILNTSNATVGPLCSPDASPTLHPNPSGSSFIVQATSPSLSFG